MIGSLLSIKQEYSQCNINITGKSCHTYKNILAGNLLTSAAILYSGSLPAKALGRRTSCFFSKLYEKQQSLVIGGDGRSDSPGHSKYGSYSMLELNLNEILDIQLVQVSIW